MTVCNFLLGVYGMQTSIDRIGAAVKVLRTQLFCEHSQTLHMLDMDSTCLNMTLQTPNGHVSMDTAVQHGHYRIHYHETCASTQVTIWQVQLHLAYQTHACCITRGCCSLS